MAVFIVLQLVAPFVFMYLLHYLWVKRGRPKFRIPKMPRQR